MEEARALRRKATANPHLTLTNKMGLGIERFNNGAGEIAALQGRVRAALRAASVGLR